jgi:hypothetical protein
MGKSFRRDSFGPQRRGGFLTFRIEAVNYLVECVVCRNRQTGFAPQSAVHLQNVSLFGPALKIIFDRG